MQPNPLAALPDELWARLESVSARCTLSITRDAPAKATLLHCRRTWRVHVQHTLGMAHDWVGTEAPTLAEAVAAAVGQAQARGWATGPAAPPSPPTAAPGRLDATPPRGPACGPSTRTARSGSPAARRPIPRQPGTAGCGA